MTAPDNDAALNPISVQSSTTLQLLVQYDDGTSRLMSTDPRVAYVVESAHAACTTLSGNVLSMVASAACTQVTVHASLQDSSLSSQVAIPVVSLIALEVSFTGYPSDNAGGGVTNRGLIECTAEYHQASVVATAWLSDGSAAIVVTTSSTFSTPDSAVVLLTDSRIQPQQAGSALIYAEFGSRAAVSPFQVVDSVLANVSAISWTIPLSESDTLALEPASTQTTVVSLSFTDGSVLNDIGNNNAVSSVLLVDVISFTSANANVINVSSTGTLTLLDNWYSAIRLAAALQCNGATKTSRDIAPNLMPAEGDVDLGSRYGLQFQQLVGGELPVTVWVRAPGGQQLTSFQLELELPTDAQGNPSVLSSGAGAYYRDAGTFSGVGDTLNDPPSKATLAASDASSTKTGTIEIGTITLAVLSSDVVLLTGSIIDMTAISPSSGQTTQFTDSAFIAGTGYADVYVSAVDGRRRRLRGIGAQLVAPRVVAARVSSIRRRRLTSCIDPCSSSAGGGIPGDFSGDCRFTVNDVLELQLFQQQRVNYLEGLTAMDPLQSRCAWQQQQANPDGDVLSGFADARDGAANSDSADALWLLNAVLKKYRFPGNVSASCDGSGLHLSVDVYGGSGQREAVVNSLSENTDVLIEMRLVSDVEYSSYIISTGSQVVDRHTFSSHNQLLAQLSSASSGFSPFKLDMLPYGGWQSSAKVQIAMLIETKDADGNKEVCMHRHERRMKPVDAAEPAPPRRMRSRVHRCHGDMRRCGVRPFRHTLTIKVSSAC